MRMRNLSALVLVFTTVNAWGALHPDLVAPAAISRISGISGLYKFPIDSEVVPGSAITGGEREPNPGGVSLGVHKDETVAMEFIEGGDILMTLRLPDEELGRVPEQLILSPEEFALLNLTMVSTGTAQDLFNNYSGYFETQLAGQYSRSKPRQHKFRQESSRGHRRSHDHNGRIAGGGGNCVSVVKSLTGFSGTAGNGVGMASALQRRGYRVTSYSSRRRGTVCSWSGGFHGKGHVGWFDGRCFQPTYGGNCGQPGSRYHLAKCVARA